MKLSHRTKLGIVFLSTIIVLVACKSATNELPAVTPAPVATTPVTSSIPKALVGTVAYPDGSATMNLAVGTTAKAASFRAADSAIYGITGTIRYKEVDYSVVGDYESSTNAISANATSLTNTTTTFYVLGIYTTADGFRGSVKRTDAGVVTKGTASAAATTTEAAAAPTTAAPTTDSVMNYMGTFSGGAVGAWNVSIKGANIQGSYTFKMSGNNVGGIFSGTIAGSNVTLTSYNEIDMDTGAPNANKGTNFGVGTLKDGILSGTWKMYGTKGTWCGAAADAKGDVPAGYTPGTDSWDSKLGPAVKLMSTAMAGMANSQPAITQDSVKKTMTAVMTLLTYTEDTKAVSGTITVLLSIANQSAPELISETIEMNFTGMDIAKFILTITGFDKAKGTVLGTLKVTVAGVESTVPISSMYEYMLANDPTAAGGSPAQPTDPVTPTDPVKPTDPVTPVTPVVTNAVKVSISGAESQYFKQFMAFVVPHGVTFAQDTFVALGAGQLVPNGTTFTIKTNASDADWVGEAGASYDIYMFIDANGSYTPDVGEYIYKTFPFAYKTGDSKVISTAFTDYMARPATN